MASARLGDARPILHANDLVSDDALCKFHHHLSSEKGRAFSRVVFLVSLSAHGNHGHNGPDFFSFDDRIICIQ